MAAVAVTVALVTCGPYEKPTSKDGELKAALFTIRAAIADYERAKGKGPQSLQDLVSAGYLKEVPTDALTGSNSSWSVQRDSASRGGAIIDVHSGSTARGQNGSPYSSW